MSHTPCIFINQLSRYPMMLIKRLTFLNFALLGIVTNSIYAQNRVSTGEASIAASPLYIILPTRMDWNTVDEGKEIAFQLGIKGGRDSSAVVYSVESGLLPGMQFDSTGKFSWTPSYDVADRINRMTTLSIVFIAHNEIGERATQTVSIRVNHVNRPPVIDDLKPFYVQYKTQNKYQIDPNAVRDPDGDPVEFVQLVTQMPEGMSISKGGEISWDPSLTYFKQIKEKPIEVQFAIEDQPFKGRTIGKVRLEATRMDMPPSIDMVSTTALLVAKSEKEQISLKFILSDPNGDDDVDFMGFISDDPRVPKNALSMNTQNSWEFNWMPDYDFVKDPKDSLGFNVTFFVLDKSKNRAEKKLRFVIKNAVNAGELDKINYNHYRNLLVEIWDSLEQLEERETKLKRDYKRAKSGKRGRSMTTASLGATTGLAPVIAKTDLDTRSLITSIGGTGIATIGTLEATEIIGKSINDVFTRLQKIMATKSNLQVNADKFTRDYGTKKARLEATFTDRLDEFRKANLIFEPVVNIELSAAWEPKTRSDDNALKKKFKYFVPLEKDK
jgi:hypothetical protein